ncbi:hypothetical protein ILUMI_05338 [Ignelater luminosus]|uniref:Partial AB-hydrolase lipase domain-containing protein n=1 Tax=Ignelater luminosus TaxID=2038154 RepID=A0A8K0D7X3_IGNLU|nr:hypothetical protein ILUMI_05338 [Ignelater luminosus]
MIQRNGYSLETHYATTEDGYILTVFRIPHGKHDSEKEIRKPVFLQHGFASSSSSFVSTGRKSLAFILADEGYDVWLGNFRGSSYSRNHTHLKEDYSEYWDFSFHEYGIYDLPAQIDLVSNVTQQKIIYIGYSMGTMSMYIYGVTYPEIVQERIRVFVNLSPSAFLGYGKNLVNYLLHLWFIVEPIVQAVTNGKVFARLAIPPEVFRYICFPYPFQMTLCQIPEMLAFGFSFEQIDPETLPVTYLQNPDWTSVKAFTHLTQLVTTGNFQKYDYGKHANALIYGSTEPPHYNLSRLSIPTYFIRAQNDLVVTKENVEQLYEALPEHAKPYDIHVIEDQNFNHLDFITAKDVVPLLYDHVVDFISKH